MKTKRVNLIYVVSVCTSGLGSPGRLFRNQRSSGLSVRGGVPQPSVPLQLAVPLPNHLTVALPLVIWARRRLRCESCSTRGPTGFLLAREDGMGENEIEVYEQPGHCSLSSEAATTSPVNSLKLWLDA